MAKLTMLVGIAVLVLSMGFMAGCGTAAKDMEGAEAAGEDPVDVFYAPLDDTVDELNRKMNSPRDDTTGKAGN